MEHYKISKLLNDSTVSKFATKHWVEVNDLSSGQYSVNKNIRFKTSLLRWYLCGYSDAHILVKAAIDLLAAAASENDKTEKDVAFQSNAPFKSCISKSCISKINSTLTDNAEDLDIVMPMYNLLEYSQNYSMTGSLWNYYRETKLMMLMILLQMVNHLNIKQKWKWKRRRCKSTTSTNRKCCYYSIHIS